MKKLLLAVLATYAILLPPTFAEAQQPASVCGTGPYVFTLVPTGVLPSVGKQVSSLGLLAKMADCKNFRIVCTVRGSTNPAEKKAALFDARIGCARVRSALLANMRSRNSAIASTLNRALAAAIPMTINQPSPAGTVSTARVYVDN